MLMMKLTKLFRVLFFTSLFLLHCKEKKENIDVVKFQIEKNIIPDSVSRKLTQYKINNTVISKQSMDIGFRNYPLVNEDYVCKANIDEKDSLNIWINNYNGYYGNGILIKVFNNSTGFCVGCFFSLTLSRGQSMQLKIIFPLLLNFGNLSL